MNTNKKITIAFTLLFFSIASYEPLRAAAEQQAFENRDDYASALAQAYAQGDFKKALAIQNTDSLSASTTTLADAKILFDPTGWWHQKSIDPKVQKNKKAIIDLLKFAIRDAVINQYQDELDRITILNPIDMGPTDEQKETIKAFASYYLYGQSGKALSLLHKIPLIAQIKVIENPRNQSWWKQTPEGQTVAFLRPERDIIKEVVDKNILYSFLKNHQNEIDAFIIKKPHDSLLELAQSYASGQYGKWQKEAKKINNPLVLVKIITALDEWWHAGDQTEAIQDRQQAMKKITIDAVANFYAQQYKKEIEKTLIPKYEKGMNLDELTDEELVNLSFAMQIWRGNKEQAVKKMSEVSVPTLIKLVTDKKNWWRSTYPDNKKDMDIFENREDIIDAIKEKLFKHFINTHQQQLEAITAPEEPIDEKAQMEAAEQQRREAELREQSIKKQEQLDLERRLEQERKERELELERKAQELRDQQQRESALQEQIKNEQEEVNAIKQQLLFTKDKGDLNKLFRKAALKFHPDKNPNSENDPKRLDRFTEYFKEIDRVRDLKNKSL